jgi:hypothetical protein
VVGYSERDVANRKIVATEIIRSEIRTEGNRREGLLGFELIQIANLSLEEIEQQKRMFVGIVSSAQINEIINPDDQKVCMVQM